jgi:hypothetical protein
LVDKLSDLQRAMDLYKRQRVKIVGLSSLSGGTFDIIPAASNQETVEVQVPICEVEKAEEPVPPLDAELPSSPMSTVDQKQVEAVSTAVIEEENMEEPVLSSIQEVQNHISTPSPKMEVLVQDYGGENQGGRQPVSSLEKKDGMASEQVNLEVADGDCLMTVGKESQKTTTFPMDDDNIDGLGKSSGNNFSYCAEEGLSDDTINGPKFFPDGSPRACEALMSGSNESESVILSRIHHSPESTH